MIVMDSMSNGLSGGFGCNLDPLNESIPLADVLQPIATIEGAD